MMIDRPCPRCLLVVTLLNDEDWLETSIRQMCFDVPRLFLTPACLCRHARPVHLRQGKFTLTQKSPPPSTTTTNSDQGLVAALKGGGLGVGQGGGRGEACVEDHAKVS